MNRTILAPRVGQGYDVHRLLPHPNGSVPICGIDIPCNFKVEAHSDGDVGLHALTEALLGAIANGNIGTHFSPSDNRWKDAESHIFVAHANSLVKDASGIIVNVDITIICEKPKVMPHSVEMRSNIANILNISESQISVKATTTEKMGFLGRQEGLAAMAVVSVLMPFEMPKDYSMSSAYVL